MIVANLKSLRTEDLPWSSLESLILEPMLKFIFDALNQLSDLWQDPSVAHPSYPYLVMQGGQRDRRCGNGTWQHIDPVYFLAIEVPRSLEAASLVWRNKVCPHAKRNKETIYEFQGILFKVYGFCGS